MELLPQFDHKFDLFFCRLTLFFLPNNGLSIQNKQVVCVNKGTWDKSEGFEYVIAANLAKRRFLFKEPKVLYRNELIL